MHIYHNSHTGGRAKPCKNKSDPDIKEQANNLQMPCLLSQSIIIISVASHLPSHRKPTKLVGTNVWLMDRLAAIARSDGGKIMNNAARERLTTRSTNGRWVSGNQLMNGSEHYPQGFGFACATLANFLNDMDPDWTDDDYVSHVSQQLVIQDAS